LLAPITLALLTLTWKFAAGFIENLQKQIKNLTFFKIFIENVLLTLHTKMAQVPVRKFQKNKKKIFYTNSN
jgi:hypothetical protein